MVLVGEVLKPQGIRGEIKVKPFTDSPSVFANFSTIYIGDIKHKILNFRANTSEVFLYVEKVITREQAELLRGKQIFVDKCDLNLEENRFLIVDCIGCNIVLVQEKNSELIFEHLGKLKDIIEYKTQTYVVELENNKTVMFPCLDDLFFKFDIENKNIYLLKKRFLEVACYED